MLEKAITVIDYDIAGLIIMVALFFMCLYSKNYKTKTGKMIIYIILFGILACVFDILQTFPRTIGLYGLWITNILYFFFKFGILYLYAKYIFTVIGLIDLVKKNKLRKMLFSAPLIIIMLLIITSPLTHFAFYFKNNGDYYEYTRGNFVFVCYLIGSIYLIIGVFSIFRYKKLFNFTEIVSLNSAYIICVLGLTIQLIYDELVELFITSLALIILISTVEKNDSFIDNVTGFGSYHAFENEIYRDYILSSKTGILLVNISNIDAIQSTLNINMENNLLYTIASNINLRCKKLDKHCDFFNLGFGVFAVIFKTGSGLHKIAEDIINDSINNENYIIKPNIMICITSNIAFPTYDKFMQFLASYNYSDIASDKIITITNSMNDSKYQIMSNIDIITNNAILNDNIDVFYQPIYSTFDNKFISIESFARINDKDNGIIKPEQFLNFCEKSGRIVQIDKIMVEKVYSFISSEQFNSLNISSININVSLYTLIHEEFISHLRNLNKKYNINTNKINFEIKDLIRLTEQKSKVLDKIKKMGYGIAIDNFGLGYYNIRLFSKTPVNIVKINNCSFNNLDENTHKILFENTANLVKNLGRRIYVTNIETEEEALMSINCGINYLQGNYYTEPLSENELIDFLKK